MIELGKKQSLYIVKTTDFGVYLSDQNQTSSQKVLLPKKQVPKDSKLEDCIEVFIYKDSEDRLIATTTEPALMLGGLAVLNVKEISKIGAFLDWGLAKDLLLPFKEQTERVHMNDKVLVSLYIDKSSRLCATMKVYEYLNQDSPYQKDDKVLGTVYEISEDFGAFVAVDNQYSALIPSKELFCKIKPGDSVEARVTSVREDGKLNLSLREKSHLQMDADSEIILSKLNSNGGFLPYNDKSDKDAIKDEFQLSKNAFKRSIGRLLKSGTIEFKNEGIALLNNDSEI